LYTATKGEIARCQTTLLSLKTPGNSTHPSKNLILGSL
jgi:hypothetical protein